MTAGSTLQFNCSRPSGGWPQAGSFRVTLQAAAAPGVCGVVNGTVDVMVTLSDPAVVKAAQQATSICVLDNSTVLMFNVSSSGLAGTTYNLTATPNNCISQTPWTAAGM